MVIPPLSAGFQSPPPLPTSKLGCSGADSQVGGFVSILCPTNSPVRLGVSPAAAATPTGVFSQWFEALFSHAGALGCAVCYPAHQLLPRRPAAPLPTALHNPPPHWVHQPPPCYESSLPWLSVSTPPTGLDECFFFISFVVGLPYSSVFSQFRLFFVFKLSFFWFCEEAQCVYLHLHLGRKSSTFLYITK